MLVFASIKCLDLTRFYKGVKGDKHRVEIGLKWGFLWAKNNEIIKKTQRENQLYWSVEKG